MEKGTPSLIIEHHMPTTMTEDPETMKWNRTTALFGIVAIALGAVVFYLSDVFNAVFTILIVSGIYFAVSFYLRDESRKSGGPSTADGAIMAGVLLAGIGVCGFIHYFFNDVTITAVCIIAVMIATASVMIVRNRKYL